MALSLIKHFLNYLNFCNIRYSNLEKIKTGVSQNCPRVITYTESSKNLNICNLHIFPREIFFRCHCFTIRPRRACGHYIRECLIAGQIHAATGRHQDVGILSFLLLLAFTLLSTLLPKRKYFKKITFCTLLTVEISLV